MARSAKSVGAAIRELREEAGLTLSGLARLAGLDTALLTRIEAERRQGMRFVTVCQIAAALGVTTDEIAVRAGLLRRKGAVQKPQATKAVALEGLRSVELQLERTRDRVEKLKKRLA